MAASQRRGPHCPARCEESSVHFCFILRLEITSPSRKTKSTLASTLLRSKESSGRRPFIIARSDPIVIAAIDLPRNGAASASSNKAAAFLSNSAFSMTNSTSSTASQGAWPVQTWFWLEWGSSTPGQSLHHARSRLRSVHSESISTRPSAPLDVRTNRSLHSADSINRAMGCSRPTAAGSDQSGQRLVLNQRSFH